MYDPTTIFIKTYESILIKVIAFCFFYLLGSSWCSFDFACLFVWIPSILSGWGLIVYITLFILLNWLIRTEKLSTSIIIIVSTGIITALDTWRVLQLY